VFVMKIHVVLVVLLLVEFTVETSISGLEIGVMYSPPNNVGPVSLVTSNKLIFTAKGGPILVINAIFCLLIQYHSPKLPTWKSGSYTRPRWQTAKREKTVHS
jgi:hypothetical protein